MIKLANNPKVTKMIEHINFWDLVWQIFWPGYFYATLGPNFPFAYSQLKLSCSRHESLASTLRHTF